MSKVGMFGGKFLPLHKGHAYVIEQMRHRCDKAYICYFINSPAEMRTERRWYLDPEFRFYQLNKLVEQLTLKSVQNGTNIPEYGIIVVDCSKFSINGKEDWEREANYIKGIIGDIDEVYSSEPSYGPIFEKAYPDSKHIIVDSDRNAVPISSTELRGMEFDRMLEWLV